MDFISNLSEHFVLVVMVACLGIGYIIKHTSLFKRVPNDDIPAILAIIGIVLNLIVSGLSVDNGVYGMMMGLASTGFHQAFTTFVEGASPANGISEDE